MIRRFAIIAALLAIWIFAPSCAEKKVEERRHTVRVRAPYTSVDVSFPADDDDEATHVDVYVDD